VLLYQEAQDTRYFDAAGFPDRTTGLNLPRRPPPADGLPSISR
jgi:hypothetical protein